MTLRPTPPVLLIEDAAGPQAVHRAAELDARRLVEDELERRAHDVLLLLAGDRLEGGAGVDHAAIRVQNHRQLGLVLGQGARASRGGTHAGGRCRAAGPRHGG